jgi:amino acid adenylation domain-containing protein
VVIAAVILSCLWAILLASALVHLHAQIKRIRESGSEQGDINPLLFWLVSGADNILGGASPRRNIERRPLLAATTPDTSRISSKLSDEAVQFWRNKLSSLPPSLSLPFTANSDSTSNRTRPPPIPTSGAACVSAELNVQDARLIDESEPVNSVLCAFAALLGMYSRQEDMVIWVHAPELHSEALTDKAWVPVRFNLDLQVNFRQLLKQVKEQLTSTFVHAAESEQIAHSAGVDLPPCQVAFSCGGDATEGLPFSAALIVLTEHTASMLTKATLSVGTGAMANGSTLRQICANLEMMLRSAHRMPSNPVASLPIIDDAETALVTQKFNQGVLNHAPANLKCIHELFHEQAEAQPHSVALIFGSRQVTYAELDHRSDRLAAALREIGVVTEDIVAMLLERSITTVVGVYGVLKAGGAYLPLDAKEPSTRLAQLLHDASPRVLLVQSATASKVPAGFSGTVVRLETDGRAHIIQGANTAGVKQPSEQPSISSLAYVMYTSGSTGKPKAVMVEHRAIASIRQWLQREHPMGAGDKLLFKTPYIWSVSRWELFWPLTVGATLVILPDDAHKMPRSLHDALVHYEITHAFFTPTQLRLLIEFCHGVMSSTAQPSLQLKQLMCVGEPLTADLCRHFFSTFCCETRLTNQCGPTEAGFTSWSCPPQGSVQLQTLRDVSIGSPTEAPVYVVDSALRPVPIGMVGELCFGGQSLARGYLNATELTSSRFVANPFGHSPTMYRTGDLAVWLPSGELQYIGRMDRQVKIRGQRLELAEVEQATLATGLVKSAVAVAAKGESDSSELVLFVIPTLADPIGSDAAETAGRVASMQLSANLQKELQMRLATYMQPSRVIPKSELPLLANGKIDYVQLQAMGASELLKSEAKQMQHASSTLLLAAAGETNELIETGIDSLGIVRALTKAYKEEEVLSNNLRAIFAAGVMIDRFNQCTNYGPPQLSYYTTICTKLTATNVPSTLSQWAPPYWLERAATALGGSKCIAGFAMVTAYFDAKHNGNGNRFDGRDLAMLVVYLEMVWVLPFIADLLSWPLFAVHMPPTASVHRWYLLALLYSRVILVTANKLHISPPVQVSLSLLASFLSRGHWVWCIASYCGAPKFLDIIGRLLLRGCWNDRNCISTSPYSGQNWLLTDGKLAIIAVYICSYHYLPAAMQTGSALALRLQNTCWTVVIKVISALVLLAISLGALGDWVGLEDSFLTYEPMPWLQVWRPHFWGKWLLVMISTTLPCILLTVLLRGTSIHFQRAGQNALGAYVIHPYFKPLLPYRTLIFAAGKWAGTIGQVLVIVGMPLLFQLLVGPLFQQLIIAHLRLLASGARWAHKKIHVKFKMYGMGE